MTQLFRALDARHVVVSGLEASPPATVAAMLERLRSADPSLDITTAAESTDGEPDDALWITPVGRDDVSPRFGAVARGEQLAVVGDGRHGFRFSQAGGGCLDLLPFSSSERRGPLAIIASSMGVAAALLHTAELDGVSASVVAIPAPTSGLSCADWMDIAARHPDVSAILIAVGETSGPRLPRLAADIVPHVPIVSLADPPAEGPKLHDWLEDAGVIVRHRLEDAVATARALAAPQLPVSTRTVIIGIDAGLNAHAQRRVADVTEMAEIRTVPGAELPAAVAAALDVPRHDLCVAVLTRTNDEPDAGLIDAESGANARSSVALYLVRPRRGHPALLDELDHGALTVTIDTLRAAIDGVGRWSSNRNNSDQKDRSHDGRVDIDAHRLRRTVHRALSSGRATLEGAEQTSEFLGILGVPGPPFRRARYLDDALLAAAEIGFPVAVGAGLETASVDDTKVAPDSDALWRMAERALAEARAGSGPDSTLIVQRATPDALRVRLRGLRADDGTPLVEINAGSETTTSVLAPDELRMERLLASEVLRGVDTSERAHLARQLAQVVGRLLAALSLDPRVAEIELDPLSLHGAGPICHSATIHLSHETTDAQ